MRIAPPALFRRPALAGATWALLLAACSPQYDWREVRGAGAPFIIALPGKPAGHTRTINLDGMPVTMTMTAAEVDHVSFAVGTAELPNAAQAEKAIGAMKTALVRNIGGALTQEKAVTIGGMPATEIEASGPPAAHTGSRPRMLLARFVARDQRIYQLIVVGGDKPEAREAADIFFSSFKPG